MKKLVIGALALIAVSAFAVDSTNIVGYTTVELVPDQFTMCGVQFEEVGSNGETISLNDLVVANNFEAVTRANRANGAQLQVLNGATYTIYYYLSDAKDASGVALDHPAWCTATGRAPSGKEPLGKGFWINVPSGVVTAGQTPSVIFKGQVSATTTQVVSFIADQFTMICNPLPVDVALNDIVTTGVTAVPRADRSNGAQLQILNGATYTIYYYINDAKNGTTPVGHDCWTTSTGRLPADSVLIKAGSSVWISSPQAGSISFRISPVNN